MYKIVDCAIQFSTEMLFVVYFMSKFHGINRRCKIYKTNGNTKLSVLCRSVCCVYILYEWKSLNKRWIYRINMMSNSTRQRFYHKNKIQWNFYKSQLLTCEFMFFFSLRKKNDKNTISQQIAFFFFNANIFVLFIRETPIYIWNVIHSPCR